MLFTKKRIIAFGLLITLFSLIAKQQRATEVPLIPIKTFFEDPQRASPSISPNAKMMAYLASPQDPNEKRVMNVWIKSIDKNDDRQITREKNRSVSSFFWSGDCSQILYVQDNNGDENWRVYGVNIQTGAVTCYTPFEKSQTLILEYNKHNPHMMLLELNKDNPVYHDIYTLNLETKELKLAVKNPGNFIQWMCDRKLQIRAAIKEIKNGKELQLRLGDTWKVIRTYGEEDSMRNCDLLGFSEKNNALYMLESKDHDTARIVAIDLKTYEVTVILQDPEYDLNGGLYINSDTDELELVRCVKEKESWVVLKKDSIAARVIKAFEDKGKVSLVSCDYNRKLWIVLVASDVSPAVYYLYNAETKKITELFAARPELMKHKLAPMEPIKYKSRDGLTIHGYLTCPVGKPKEHLPLIVNVHGGPHLRDTWGYDGRVQWLANRGYAVLQINYRGSLGYGKKFLTACTREWGGKMHDDLIDGVNWAIKGGIADPKKIAIFGGSYGGYAALVGAAFTPDVFCCSVDICGPSNLSTMLASYPPYWKPWLEKSYVEIGNPHTEPEFVKSRSPLFKAHEIKIPMLIAQGGMDVRVTKEESEQIVEALKKNNIPHEYLLFPDEGHGFVDEKNRLHFFKTTEAFFARHLGGRCEA